MAVRNIRTQNSWWEHTTDNSIRGLTSFTGLFWVLCTTLPTTERMDILKLGHPWRGGTEGAGAFLTKMNGNSGELIQYTASSGISANVWYKVAFVIDGPGAGRGWIFLGQIGTAMTEVSYTETINETITVLEATQAGHNLRIGNANDGAVGMPRGWAGDIAWGCVWRTAIPDVAELNHQADNVWTPYLDESDMIFFSHYGLDNQLSAPDWKNNADIKRPATFTSAGGYPQASLHPPLGLREPLYQHLGFQQGLFSHSGWNPALWNTGVG